MPLTLLMLITVPDQPGCRSELACRRGRKAVVMENMLATLVRYVSVQSSTVEDSGSNRFCFISVADLDSVVRDAF